MTVLSPSLPPASSSTSSVRSLPRGSQCSRGNSAATGSDSAEPRNERRSSSRGGFMAAMGGRGSQQLELRQRGDGVQQRGVAALALRGARAGERQQARPARGARVAVEQVQQREL